MIRGPFFYVWLFLALANLVRAIWPPRSVGVKPFAHFLARFKIGHALGWDVYRITCARIAAGARFALPCRECSKTAQFNPAIFSKSRRNLFKENIDDLFDFFRSQVRVISCKQLQ